MSLSYDERQEAAGTLRNFEDAIRSGFTDLRSDLDALLVEIERYLGAEKKI